MSVQGSVQTVISVMSAWRTPKRIALLPHLRADADSLAAVIALQALLERQGHLCDILTDEPVPHHISFLTEGGRIEIYEADHVYDQLIWVDHHQAERLGRREGLLRANPAAQILIIDHHQPADEGIFANEVWLDPTRSSASEMVAQIFFEWPEDRLDSLLAETLLAGIYADTGGLRYSNATCAAYETCAQLCSRDISVERVCRRLFAELPLSRIRLRGRVFAEAALNPHGNLIWCALTQADLDRLGARQSDLEGIVSMLREVAGIDLAVLVQITSDSRARVSMRSSERFNSAAFAKLYGGGGHIRAAGFDFPLVNGTDADSADEQIRQLIETADEQLNGAGIQA